MSGLVLDVFEWVKGDGGCDESWVGKLGVVGEVVMQDVLQVDFVVIVSFCQLVEILLKIIWFFLFFDFFFYGSCVSVVFEDSVIRELNLGNVSMLLVIMWQGGI